MYIFVYKTLNEGKMRGEHEGGIKPADSSSMRVHMVGGIVQVLLLPSTSCCGHCCDSFSC